MSRTYRLNWTRGRMKPAVPQAPTAEHYLWLSHGFYLLTFYGCLIPLRYRSMLLDEALAAFRQISLRPVAARGAGDWVVSIVRFAIVSYLYMAALCVNRRRAFGLASAALVVPGCLFLSIVQEFLQVDSPPVPFR